MSYAAAVSQQSVHSKDESGMRGGKASMYLPAPLKSMDALSVLTV